MSELNVNFDENKLKKRDALLKKGINLYPHNYKREIGFKEIKELYKDIGHEKSKKTVVIAGSVQVIRRHGRTIFVDLKDETGYLQLYLREDSLGKEKFQFFKDYVDSGDIIGANGNVFRTKLGEISIWVNDFLILAKSLSLLPEKYHGLKDVAKRYRNRYIDLRINDESRNIFRIRSKIISLIRTYLEKKDFLEFETPILQPIYGGANARPFTTHHKFLDQNFFLRIAPELYLKRLIVGGFEKVFEIAKNFRNEDIDTLHNPEFTMVEIYEAYRDYFNMMDMCEDLISKIILEINGTCEIRCGDSVINFKPPWKRISMESALIEYEGIEVLKCSLNELKKMANAKEIVDYENAHTHGDFLILFFETLVEKKLKDPAFIYDFPIENSPLAKKHRTKKGFTERFELFINGWEIANGFSELNDPLDQKERFENQEKRRLQGDPEAQMIDTDYLNALGLGMPPTGGIGIGIDRLVMLATNNTSIKEVILFPQMKKIV